MTFARIGIGLALAAAVGAGTWAGGVPPRGVFPEGADASAGGPVRLAGSRVSMTTVNASQVSALAIDERYDAMRDDVNPKPRLLLIEAWDRDASPDAPLDLLTRALVDPDAAVRERAQALFDRRLATR